MGWGGSWTSLGDDAWVINSQISFAEVLNGLTWPLSGEFTNYFLISSLFGKYSREKDDLWFLQQKSVSL